MYASACSRVGIARFKGFYDFTAQELEETPPFSVVVDMGSDRFKGFDLLQGKPSRDPTIVNHYLLFLKEE